jgi:hypothetical protein
MRAAGEDLGSCSRPVSAPPASPAPSTASAPAGPRPELLVAQDSGWVPHLIGVEQTSGAPRMNRSKIIDGTPPWLQYRPLP